MGDTSLASGSIFTKIRSFSQRFKDVRVATALALLHLGPIILVFMLVWFAASTSQVGDALGESSFFTALAVVLFWGVLMASTWVLIKVALSDHEKELKELQNVRFLVSCLFFIGVITLPHYWPQMWWRKALAWFAFFAFFVFTLLVPLLRNKLVPWWNKVVSPLWNDFTKRSGFSNNQVPRRLVGIVALVSLAVGVFFQAIQFQLDHNNSFYQIQFWFPVLLLISYAGFYLFLVTGRTWLDLLKRRESGYVHRPGHLWAILLGGLAVIFLTAVGDPRIAHSCGIPALLLLTFSAWIGLITIAMVKLRGPVLVLILLAGVWQLWPGARFEHLVRAVHTRAGKTKKSGVPLDFADAYKDWLSDRLHGPDAKPYDVYIVLAEGGGIRAAYQTALTLAYLEDLQSGFHKHVFAISGVSGGSVGAAVFSALCRLDDTGHWPEDKNGKKVKWTELVEEVFSRDLLAAPVGALIGREVFQYLWPSGLLGEWGVNYGLVLDRAIALETSLESAFFGTTGQNLLADALYFKPKGTSAPLLLLNATETVTGRRAVISSVNLESDAKALYPLSQQGAPQLQLSTAALISARFPLISPIARLSLDGGKESSLVDGGYLDNTGALTAKAVLDKIKSLLDAEGQGPGSQYRIHLIIPRFKPFTKTLETIMTYDQVQENQSRYQLLEKKGKKEVYLDHQTGQKVTVKSEKEERSELDEIVLTFLNVHSAYNSSLAPAEEALGKYPEQQRGEVFVVTFVEKENVPQPLGWFISKRARESLRLQLPDPPQRPTALAQLEFLQAAQEAKEYDEACSKNDASALAALFTEDAVQVVPEGVFYRREAIKKGYAELVFQHYNNHVLKVDRVIAVGNELCWMGEWSCNYDGTPIHGYLSNVAVREDGAWKIRFSTRVRCR